MVITENECVDCGLPCLYKSCPYYEVTRLYCDKCNDEQMDLYWFGNKQLCINCIEEQLERVEIND